MLKIRLLLLMLKICRMPPPEPCKGLREKMDAAPPVPGAVVMDFTGEKAVGQAVLLFNFLVRPSKNPCCSSGN